MMSLGLATARNDRPLTLICNEVARLEPICRARLIALSRGIGYARFVGWFGLGGGFLVGRLWFIIYSGQLGFERRWIYILLALCFIFVCFVIVFGFAECILFAVALFFRLCLGSFRNLDEVEREKKL